MVCVITTVFKNVFIEEVGRGKEEDIKGQRQRGEREVLAAGSLPQMAIIVEAVCGQSQDIETQSMSVMWGAPSPATSRVCTDKN